MPRSSPADTAEPRDRETVAVDAVLDVIDDVEEEVLAEDKLGASRDQVASGTCARIKRRLNNRFQDGGE